MPRRDRHVSQVLRQPERHDPPKQPPHEHQAPLAEACSEVGRNRSCAAVCLPRRQKGATGLLQNLKA